MSDHSIRNVHLCRITTEDGVILDGSLEQPKAESSVTLDRRRTAFLLVHGTGSNFYSPGILEMFAECAVSSGVAALRINTRGHDEMSSAPGLGRTGAAFESVADCRFDIAAWIDFLVGLNFDKVILVGHSMGGVKSIFSQAHAAHSVVTGIVCLSPPRFCHTHWMSHPGADHFRSHFEFARRLVESGNAEQLIECRQPLRMHVTAAGFLDKYGPGDKYDIVRLMPKVACPVLVMIGTETVHSSPAFDSLPNEIQRLSSATPEIRIELIAGENMNYSNDPRRPFQLVKDWMC